MTQTDSDSLRLRKTVTVWLSASDSDSNQTCRLLPVSGSHGQGLNLPVCRHDGWPGFWGPPAGGLLTRVTAGRPAGYRRRRDSAWQRRMIILNMRDGDGARTVTPGQATVTVTLMGPPP